MPHRTNVGKPIDVEIKETEAKTKHLVETVKASLVYFVLGPGTFAVLATLAFGYWANDYEYFYGCMGAYSFALAAVIRHYFKVKRKNGIS